MKRDYFLYMAEAEGCYGIVTTRQTKINAAINDFIEAAKNRFDINNNNLQNSIFSKYDLYDLTDKELRYIAETVQKRL